MQIPKIIFYCWFGGNPLPKSAVKCINSWKKFLPDYEVREINESNFDVNMIPYTAEAYEVKKYAYVSDYARFWALYKWGGVYFDTDVELVAPINDILDRGPYMGIEVPAHQGELPMVNPGLGIAVSAGHSVYKHLLDYYKELHYMDENGLPYPVTVVFHTTKVLSEHGMQPVNAIQCVDDIWIYPEDYFNPLDDLTGTLTKKTHNTRSIHWYNKSWMGRRGSNKLYNKITRILHRYLGISFVNKVGNLIRKIK